MAEAKTRPTKVSVEKFLGAIADPEKQADARAVAAMMKQVTRATPRMWGPNIIGFGSRMLKYAGGREVEWPVIAFSPRKPSLVLYLTLDGYEEFAPLMKKLGTHRTGRSCLYIKRLADVDRKVLKELISASARASGKSRGRVA